MKIKIKENKVLFKPLTVEIQIDSWEELDSFCEDILEDSAIGSALCGKLSPYYSRAQN